MATPRQRQPPTPNVIEPTPPISTEGDRNARDYFPVNSTATSTTNSRVDRRNIRAQGKQNGDPNHLRVRSEQLSVSSSRSPSPAGLIPLHQSFRVFVHKHEVPRKLLHVSIGFFTLHLYTRGVQTSAIHPWLLGALIPIATVDLIRHRFAAVNGLYVRLCGALMRESEVNDRYNGVIFYLLGAWTALRFFPKDVGVMSVLMLSWCDTAASTIGRQYGRYTRQLRQGKSLAGSLAAAVTGMATALLWWGFITPAYFGYESNFMYQGTLSLQMNPMHTQDSPGWAISISGWGAVTILSLWSGLIASGSEFVDLFGLDDNLTIPVLSSIGLWGFLKIFA